MSRDYGNLACRMSLTRHGIYFRAQVRCRACPHAYLCVRHKVQRGEWEEGNGSTKHIVLLSACILADYSDCRHHPRLSRRVTSYSLSQRVSASIARARAHVRTCVHACVHACVRFGRVARKVELRIYVNA